MTNEELSISDATLIESLRLWNRDDAADRIEQLTAERDEAWKRAAHAERMWGEVEVKLAKAIDLLHRHCDPWGMNDFDATTLAEFKSGVATTPYGLEGENHE